MKITDFLSQDAVVFDLKARDKESAIREMVEVLVKQKIVKNPDETVETLIQREKLGSTGIGQGVAIPHGRVDFIKEEVAVLAISKNGINYDALDGNPVQIIFMLLSPEGSKGEHLQAMATISKLLKDKSMRQALMDAKTPQELIEVIQKVEKG